MKKLFKAIGFAFRHRVNFIKTFYVNFHYFPFFTAIRFPVILIGKVYLGSCKTGKIIFKEKPFSGMLIVGLVNRPHPDVGYTTFVINGTLEISGKILICNGSSIVVYKGGVLSIGNNSMFNVRNKVWCINKISIGSNLSTSWECQIFDSNFHYIVDSNGNTKRHYGTVTIGDSCWLGNRCTINKGAQLPNYTIVAAGSFVNKDFEQFNEGCTIAGTPAKLISIGNRRIMNRQKEKELNDIFSNPEISSYHVGIDPSLSHWE